MTGGTPTSSLTAEFDADEVLDAQIFQEDPGGGCGFEQKGDVCVQLAVEGGEVQVRRLLVEKRRVPEVLCETTTTKRNNLMSFFNFWYITLEQSLLKWSSLWWLHNENHFVNKCTNCSANWMRTKGITPATTSHLCWFISQDVYLYVLIYSLNWRLKLEAIMTEISFVVDLSFHYKLLKSMNGVIL